MKVHTGKRTRTTLAAVALLASAALASACGSDSGGEDVDPGSAAEAPSYEAALDRAPRDLAAFYENGPELIEGGETAYDDALASVEGTPVVVNHWGSWCGPCREEFPHFQNQAAEHLDEVAFLGVDTQDSADAYATFIRDHPIPYPSVEDLEGEFGNWIDTALVGQPNTVYYDARGELVYTHQGPYETEADLAADIERYALSS